MCTLKLQLAPKRLLSDSIIRMFGVVHEHRKNIKNQFRGMHFLWGKGAGCHFLWSPWGLGYDHGARDLLGYRCQLSLGSCCDLSHCVPLVQDSCWGCGPSPWMVKGSSLGCGCREGSLIAFRHGYPSLEIGSGYVKNSMSVLDATNYTNMYEGGETTEAEHKLIKLSIFICRICETAAK